MNKDSKNTKTEIRKLVPEGIVKTLIPPPPEKIVDLNSDTELKTYKFRNPNHKVDGFHNCLSHKGKHDLFHYDGYKLDLEDGVYEVNINETSFKRIEDIPKQKNVYSYRHIKYPQFTHQHLKGKLSVKNKTIDLKELDELIPNNWWRYNSHFWLENIEIHRDSWCDNNTPYLSLEFGS